MTIDEPRTGKSCSKIRSGEERAGGCYTQEKEEDEKSSSCEGVRKSAPGPDHLENEEKQEEVKDPKTSSPGEGLIKIETILSFDDDHRQEKRS